MLRFDELSWADKRGLELATEEAKSSRDPSTKVGAVLHYRDCIAKCCNTFSGEGFDPETATREERYAAVVHAEVNVLRMAGPAAEGGTLYCSEEPCSTCCDALLLAGVRRVVHFETTEDRRERWDCAAGREKLATFFVERVEVRRP